MPIFLEHGYLGLGVEGLALYCCVAVQLFSRLDKHFLEDEAMRGMEMPNAIPASDDDTEQEEHEDEDRAERTYEIAGDASTATQITNELNEPKGQVVVSRQRTM